MARGNDHREVPQALGKKRLERLVRFHLFLKGDNKNGQAPAEWTLSALLSEFGGTLTGGGLLTEPLPVMLDIMELRHYAQALGMVDGETAEHVAPVWASDLVFPVLRVLRENVPTEPWTVEAAVAQFLARPKASNG